MIPHQEPHAFQLSGMSIALRLALQLLALPWAVLMWLHSPLGARKDIVVVVIIIVAIVQLASSSHSRGHCCGGIVVIVPPWSVFCYHTVVVVALAPSLCGRRHFSVVVVIALSSCRCRGPAVHVVVALLASWICRRRHRCRHHRCVMVAWSHHCCRRGHIVISSPSQHR
jgi:hypothetical protein